VSRRGGDPRGGGTSAWVTAVRERTFGNVTEKLLMMILCDYINGDDECWPGNTALAPDVGVDPRTIRRTLDRLEAAGVIARRRRENSGKGRANDAIQFLWGGFQRLPLVDGSSPDLGDNLSDDLGDNSARPRGHSEGVPRGHSAPPSSFRTPPVEPPQKNPAVIQVFEAWKASTKRTAATVLDAPRTRLITAALKSYPIEDVLDAVRGWEHSPHHRGENAEGKVYNDLGLLLRNAENIERFRDYARNPPAVRRIGTAKSETPAGVAALLEWERREQEATS
jgi:DNA-binding transcriptional ArsR family regulator